MQKIRKVFGAFVLLGLTLSADAMKRTAEDAGAFGKEPYIKQSHEVEQSYEAPEFSLSMPVVPLKAKLTQEILADWPLNTPEKVIKAIKHLLQWRFALTNPMIIDILLVAWVQVDSTEEWRVVIDKDVIQNGNHDCADILIDLYLACGKVVLVSLLEFNQIK